MTPPQAFSLALFGLLLIVAGLVWLFGAWALVGSGVVVAALALLIPVKERRAEPIDETVPPVS